MVVALADYAALHHTRYSTTLADYAASGLKKAGIPTKGKPKIGKCNYAVQHTSFNDIGNDIIEQGAEKCLAVGRAAGVARDLMQLKMIQEGSSCTEHPIVIAVHDCGHPFL